MSAPDPERDEAFWKEGQYAVDLPTVARNVEQASRPRIELIPGFFSSSLIGEAAQRVGPIAFARIDCDIYEPALDCLKYLSTRLSHGAILVFDDWPHVMEVGECLAFREWLPAVPNLEFELLCVGTYKHLYLRVWHRDKKRLTAVSQDNPSV